MASRKPRAAPARAAVSQASMPWRARAGAKNVSRTRTSTGCSGSLVAMRPGGAVEPRGAVEVAVARGDRREPAEPLEGDGQHDELSRQLERLAKRGGGACRVVCEQGGQSPLAAHQHPQERVVELAGQRGGAREVLGGIVVVAARQRPVPA